MSYAHKLESVSTANLKLMSEFFLYPSCQAWFLTTVGQEQKVFKIDDLREDRRPLTNPFRILWWLSMRRNELQACCIDDLAGLLNVLTSEFGPPEDDATRGDRHHGLSLEMVVVPIPYFDKFFPRKLAIFRLELDSRGDSFQVLGEVHSVRTSLIHEERMDGSV